MNLEKHPEIHPEKKKQAKVHILPKKKKILATGFNLYRNILKFSILDVCCLWSVQTETHKIATCNFPTHNQSQPDVSPKRHFLVTFPVVRETSQNPPESRQKPPRPRVVPLESYRAGDSPNGSAMYGNFSGSKPVNHLEPTTKIIVISWKCCVCQITRVCCKLSPQQKNKWRSFWHIYT